MIILAHWGLTSPWRGLQASTINIDMIIIFLVGSVGSAETEYEHSYIGNSSN